MVGVTRCFQPLDDLRQATGRDRAAHLTVGQARRTRLSMQPTLTATPLSSLASGMIWHCGFPSKRRSGRASCKTISLLGIEAQEDYVGVNRGLGQRAVRDVVWALLDRGNLGTTSIVTQPVSKSAVTSLFLRPR